ncbi:MAG: 4-hydroxy-tetrahydrodipicolinate synthase [Cyclobacteriaceae bacterium]|jgi:4-hydroxy-tetrahydrodipicolinate synthase
MYNKFIGTGVALVTPFDNNLKVNFNELEKVVTHTIAEGIDYLVVQGTTGESVTINEHEKIEILNKVNEVNTDKPVVMGIGGNDTSKVLSQIDALSGESFDAILSVCPYYNKPSQSHLINHFTEIADKAPKPVILYNVPGRTSVNLSAQSTAELSRHPNIIGVKEASGNFNQAVDIIKLSSDDFLLISGDDFLTLPLISIGAVGVISVLANALTSEMCNIVNYARNNKYADARRILYSIKRMNELMYLESNPVGVKFLMETLGICSGDVRPPLYKASRELQGKIKSALMEIKNPA